MAIRIDTQRGEMMLYGIVGEDRTSEAFTASDVLAALGKMQGRRVTVRLNSPGGDVAQGIAIYNALKRYQPGVDTINDAVAASIGSVIFLAGSKRTMADGSLLMIHDAWSQASGSASDLQRMVDALQAHQDSIVGIYAQATGLPDAKLRTMMQKETWLDAKQAVELGFATQTESRDLATPIAARWFKRPPRSFAAMAKPVSTDNPYSVKIAAIRKRNGLI